ncbi:recombinase family protein [Streptomyces sp. NPDC058682]|uniref:recombinase family protein n=1 Tax=Streptomyces sp. NPDC058682 TaxID=3346596 RepID=UPI0036606685
MAARHPDTPTPAPVDPGTPSADIRIGYARCSSLTQELQSQLDAPARHGIPRDEILAEKISTRVRVRPQFEAALADHPTAHGLVLEMLAGPLRGMYDPSGPGRLLFGFFAAMAETERENIRQSTLEGLDAAARKGNHGGQPPGHSPGLSSIYRALAEHEKTQAYPKAVETAHAECAALQQRDRSP